MSGRERALAAAGLLLATVAVAVPLLLPPGEAWPRSGTFRAALLCGALAVAAGVALEAARRARSRRAPFRLSPSGVGLLVSLPVYLLLVGNGATLSTGDTLALRWLPSRLLTAGTLDLAGTPAFRVDPEHYSAVASGGRLLPMASPGTAFVLLPHAAAALAASGGTVTPALVERWEKHAAALLLSASAAFLFLTARRALPETASLATAFVFALATPAFTTAGQALFPSTGLFAVCLALVLLPAAPSRSRGRAAASGLAASLAFLCRPAAAIEGAGLFVLVAGRRKGEAGAFGAAAFCGLAVSAGFLLVLHGHPLGAYGRVNLAPDAWTRDVFHGLAGVLASPSRGILLFCPYLLLAPAAWRAARGDGSLERLWLVSLGVSSSVVLLTACYAKWWGGHGIGPRILVTASPFLALLAGPLFCPAAGRAPRVAALLLASGSAATQLAAAYTPGVPDWNTLVDVDRNPRVLWSLRDSQLAATWLPGWRPSAGAPPSRPAASAAPPAPSQLAADQGLLCSVDEPRAGATVRGTLVVFGWARAEGEDLPVRVLIDGEDRTPQEVERLPRPDVAASFPGLGDASRAGFLCRVPMRAADAGPRRVDLLLRARDGRERLYPGPAFTWAP